MNNYPQDYHQTYPRVCPACEKDSIDKGVFVEEDGIASRHVTCNSCGLKWVEEYQFNLWSDSNDSNDSDDSGVVEEDDDDPYPFPDCPACNNVAGFIGLLGDLAWFRCIHCGMEFNVHKSKIGL